MMQCDCAVCYWTDRSERENSFRNVWSRKWSSRRVKLTACHLDVCQETWSSSARRSRRQWLLRRHDMTTAVCLSVCLSVCLYICLSVCLSVCLSLCLSVCLSRRSRRRWLLRRHDMTTAVCLSVCLSVYLSVCLSVKAHQEAMIAKKAWRDYCHLSVCLSVSLSLCLSVCQGAAGGNDC